MGFLDSFREPDARKLRDRRDVDGLIKALKHDRGHVRDQAAAALGELWSAQVCEALVSALSSDNADTARKAANILEDKGWKPQTDEELARLLMAKDDWVSLAKQGDRVVGTLVSQLTDNKVDVQRRWAISIALGNIDTPTAVQSLTSVKGEVSVFAVSALGRTTQLRDVAVRRVVEALKTSPDGASGAPMSLFLLGSAAVDALAEILWGGMKSKDVFGAALGCLAATGDPRVLSVLDRIATEDRDCKADIDNIRKMYESPPASLLNAARHPKLAVRGCAMMALGNRREHAAIDVLTSALKDSGSPLAPYAALAMGKLGTEAAVGPLTNAVSNGSPVTRKYVAEALGMCGEPSALEPLARLAADADVAVRAQAQLSIERIKSGARIVAGGSHQHQDHEFDTPIDATYTGSGGSPVA